MNDLEFYKKWCLIRLDYDCLRTLELEKGHNNYDEIREFLISDTQDLKNRLLKDFEKGNLRKMKKWFSACNESPPEPGDPDYPILNKLLFDACGKGLDDLYKKRWERIAKIKERGKLRSDSEFYLVQEHIDYLLNTNAPEDEVKLFDGMIFDYEERARKRMEKQKKAK